MKHIRGLVSAAQALRRTFLTPPQIPNRPQFLRYEPFLARTQLRLIQHSRGPVTDKSGLVTDEKIRAEFVHIVNESGSLDEPIRLNNVLRSIDRSKFFLLQVSPATPDKPPVCKIVSKQAMREIERTKAKAAVTASKNSVKQIELNWAIDAHDLAHRLKQLRTFLDKGRKVEIILTRKKGKRPPTADEVRNLMTRVMETTQEANAIPVKPVEGEPGKHVVVVVKKRED
ncbi:hypothetical protein ASPZODRAFT_156877 [Penicilliopsis zonata CBS 506.65]|uniref:Translation initiation factor 3 C-terminal domain-containing protein n=1 Tax=Penicilliopsis zonata CBS 506.65 TaxID=1073090 RepID=A0A1L9SRK2_9EURO|nr:hypothetical protein ASPZODRAFT_156877 [Penicilliopsis zonata CBS 506.65]OJJ49840.1 hypothetical protein ASPZODRAFT_156877 [Penicilliopsis zonata CBS 506.65]